jgi:ABC-type transport system substrate-binding protein
VEAQPGNRLRVLFSIPNRTFDQALTNPRMRIAHPRHLMQPRIDAGEVGVSPLDVGLVGIGPFKIGAYDRGSLVRVTKFDRYWERDAAGRQMPYLDGIDYVIMSDATAMDMAFRTGRLDGGARGEGHYLTSERKEGYVRDLGDNVWFAEIQGGQLRLAFNVLKEGPWQDDRVRRAIGMWIDREAAIPSVMGGMGYIVPPDTPYSTPEFVNWPFFDRRPLEERRAEAKQLMQQADHADGFPMTYLCRNNAPERCEFLKAQLAGLNIDLQLELVDEATWNRSRTTLEFDSQNGANFAPPVLEATESVYGVYSQNRDAYTKHEDAQVSALYDQLGATANPATRVDVWRALERYLFHEKAYLIPIANSLQVVPYRTYVKGLPIPAEDGHGDTDFATVWLER